MILSTVFIKLNFVLKVIIKVCLYYIIISINFKIRIIGKEVARSYEGL